MLETEGVDSLEEEKTSKQNKQSYSWRDPHMTHGRRLTRWLRSLGKAEADIEADTGAETPGPRHYQLPTSPENPTIRARACMVHTPALGDRVSGRVV
jgi:hypothetical protein